MDPINHPSLSLPTTLSSASQGADTLSDLRMDHIDHRLDASLPLLDTPPSPDQGAHTWSDLMAAQPSASSAPQVQHTKRPLTPSYDLPAKAKRPRNLVHPLARPQTQKQVRVSKPVGTSKQAVAKQKANECVLNGTFSHNPKRWEDYKWKLAELDPGFEVSEDPKLVRQVKHSTCGGWFVMAAPYDKERFKKHVASCSYSTGGGSMKSLESFGVLVLSAGAFSSSSSPSSAPSPASTSTGSTTSSLPCPGLTEKDGTSISQYFSRTSVTSAGGEDLHSVARSLFSDEFKNLSSEKKDLVRLKQKQTHTWSIDHLMKTIHAIGKSACEGNADIASDGSLMACKACQSLLTSQAFKKAISRKPAPNKNRAYIPHVYQPAVIGKMYSLGFNDLIDGVSARLNFQSCRQLIRMLDIQSQ